MAKSGVTIEGLGRLQRNLSLAAMQARAAAQAAVVAEVAAVRDDAVSGAPVDTGELRDGIVGKPMGLDGEVRATTRHSDFVEHGTSKDPAQPFMAPAAERSRKRFPVRAGAMIRASLERIR